MTNKLTNKIALNSALSFIPDTAENAELRAKLEGMIAALDKKNASPRKLTERQTENAALKDVILDAMEAGKGYTVSELMSVDERIGKLTNQRVSAIMNQMKEDGLLDKYSEKRRTYFRLVDAE